MSTKKLDLHVHTRTHTHTHARARAYVHFLCVGGCDVTHITTAVHGDDAHDGDVQPLECLSFFVSVLADTHLSRVCLFGRARQQISEVRQK